MPGDNDRIHEVAPRVGAWIEIRLESRSTLLPLVAPRVGAWIEILLILARVPDPSVAPRVGAWIEIEERQAGVKKAERRTPCGCVD